MTEPVDVTRWRVSERKRLIETRLAIPADERRRRSEAIAATLDTLLAPGPGCVVSLYWPFRGEPNLREWMRDAVARGARVALPVVEAKGRPLRFREWTPTGRMAPGVWNIPVPIDGEPMWPEILVAPLVGFDAGGYRLGYGGGFFDRTLADLRERGREAWCVGVGYEEARMPSIHPQAHDVRMDAIVTGSACVEHSPRPDRGARRPDENG